MQAEVKAVVTKRSAHLKTSRDVEQAQSDQISKGSKKSELEKKRKAEHEPQVTPERTPIMGSRERQERLTQETANSEKYAQYMLDTLSATSEEMPQCYTQLDLSQELVTLFDLTPNFLNLGTSQCFECQRSIKQNLGDDPKEIWALQCLRCKQRFCADCFLPTRTCFYCDIAMKKRLVVDQAWEENAPVPYGLYGGGNPKPFERMTFFPMSERV